MACYITIITVFLVLKLVQGAPQVPCYFIFGDSLLDNGNNNDLNTAARANYLPYGVDFSDGPTGRFTNGRNMADFLAEHLGFDNYIPPYASAMGDEILQGVNYASGSAGIRNDTGNHLISTQQVICTHVLIEQYSQQLKDLYEDGARKITLFGLPQIGCIPDELKNHSTLLCVDSTNAAVQLFNKNLKALVDDLNTNLPDAQFIYINMYSISSAIALTLLNYPCCQVSKIIPEGQCIPGKGPCLIRSTHLFFNNFHPTEIANSIATHRAYNALLPSDAYPMDIRHLVTGNDLYYDQ
ncbi:gdsl esteraselipase [Nicotiana attenuata]|uniref:Gdsl esteraselipase n=1 Tax=Nicotiana attenuata TaxID=49451 RepID=A0A1J6KAZ5_NICAT|nr:gdsl esteraselipase [Nicotiana attenuata]